MNPKIYYSMIIVMFCILVTLIALLDMESPINLLRLVPIAFIGLVSGIIGMVAIQEDMGK